MPHPFDATMKKLVKLNPSAWLPFVDSNYDTVEVVEDEPLDWEALEKSVSLADTDLSTVTSVADVLLRVTSEGSVSFRHIEFQAGPLPRLMERTHLQNTLIHCNTTLRWKALSLF